MSKKEIKNKILELLVVSRSRHGVAQGHFKLGNHTAARMAIALVMANTHSANEIHMTVIDKLSRRANKKIAKELHLTLAAARISDRMNEEYVEDDGS